jgi:Flp pilus assembly protein TadG
MHAVSFSSVLKRFRTNAKGNVAIIFSLSVIPLLMGVGTAVDYMRATDTKARMERALDAAALAVGNAPDMTNADMRKLAIRYFRENYPKADEAVDASLKIMLNGDRIALSVDAKVPTTLLNIVGVKDIPVSISNEVVRSGNNLEVALALDITGSMGNPNSKIAALKVAAKDLVDILVSDNQYRFYSKVALAPYATAVNVGNYADQLRGVPTPGVDTVPGSQQYEFTSGSGQQQIYDVSTCVTERTGPEAYTDADPQSAPASTYRLGWHYGYNFNPCPSAEIVPLTSDKAALKQQIDQMTEMGSTAGHLGAAWAWYLLSPNFGNLWPAGSQPAPYGKARVTKAAIIMTDGAFNTAYCNGVVSNDSNVGAGGVNARIGCDAPNGSAFDQAQQICDGMKAKGIMVFTVGFMIDNQPQAQNIMQQCASSPSMAYDADTGVELKTAFANIANSLSELRLSK